MPILAVGTDRQRGFTLVELIVALALGGLLLAILPAKLNALIEAAQYQNAVQSVVRVLESARIKALSEGVRAYISIDSRNRKLFADGVLVQELSPGFEWEAVGVAEAGQVLPTFFFDQDGSASGGKLTIAGAGRRNLVEIDWLTGQVLLRRLP